MNVVAHARSIRGVVVIPKNRQEFASSHSCLADIGHQVVGRSVRVLADVTAGVGADRVEISQKHDGGRILVLGHAAGMVVSQNMLYEVLRSAISIRDPPASGGVLCDGHLILRSVNSRRRGKNKGVALRPKL